MRWGVQTWNGPNECGVLGLEDRKEEGDGMGGRRWG